MCETLNRTHRWIATEKRHEGLAWGWTRTLILQCRHCAARKKITTSVTY